MTQERSTGGTGSERPGEARSPQRQSRGASLVALSSVAVAAIYAVGYIRTEPAAELGLVPSAQIAATTTVIALAAIPPSTTPAPSAATRPSATPRATSPAAVSSAYRDGSFVGTGSSRHGNIEATIVVQGDRIVSASITGCYTRYPCSKVESLPAHVQSAQAATADYVSGATDSSRAYMGAVRAALQKAAAAA